MENFTVQVGSVDKHVTTESCEHNKEAKVVEVDQSTVVYRHVGDGPEGKYCHFKEFTIPSLLKCLDKQYSLGVSAVYDDQLMKGCLF